MGSGNRLFIYYVTEGGRAIAGRIAAAYPEAETAKFAKGRVQRDWPHALALIFVCASGIAVRSIAPFIKDKSQDPAVLVVDEMGRHVVSLLGGHEAGANALAGAVASAIGATPVITTATDAHGLASIDVFAKRHGLIIEDRTHLARISSLHIEKGRLDVFSETGIALPPGMSPADDISDADVAITHRRVSTNALVLRPRTIVLGIGLNSGTKENEIGLAVESVCDSQGISPLSIGLIGTHEKKKSEPGLKGYASRTRVEVLGFTTEELNAVEGVEESGAARRALGVRAVAEPAALLASGSRELLMRKVKKGNLTLALCLAERRDVFVVGTGPGGPEHMTPEALRAIRDADVVVGFRSYVEHIKDILWDKDVLSYSMTEEVERVRRVVALSLQGKRVALISGGDPGVYAMAGLVYEVVRAMDAPVDVRVIPGISALNACAARLGAPLMHDFCAISLSDRLTPWPVIERRIEAASQADFVIALYNPRSRGRRSQIERAREIILGHRSPAAPVGIVRSAMRPDEDVVVTDIEHMLDHEIDMKSTVIVGNSMSFRFRDRIVTPRGYGNKYEF